MTSSFSVIRFNGSTGPHNFQQHFDRGSQFQHRWIMGILRSPKSSRAQKHSSRTNNIGWGWDVIALKEGLETDKKAPKKSHRPKVPEIPLHTSPKRQTIPGIPRVLENSGSFVMMILVFLFLLNNQATPVILKRQGVETKQSWWIPREVSWDLKLTSETNGGLTVKHGETMKVYLVYLVFLIEEVSCSQTWIWPNYNISPT